MYLRRFLFAAAVCASFVASAQEPEPAAAVEPAAAGTAPEPAAAAETAAANTGTGTVVFFREKKFAGAAIRYKVREGDVELGKLSSGSYFTVQMPAGKHELMVHSEAKDILSLEVEPGETYYIVGSVSMGLLAGHPNLSPSDQATFEGMKGELKDVTPTGSAAASAAK
jgi:hypothetical protein